ncbi:MAG: type II toxin-antitoxin system HicB family antitoxin [Betaproteobacteria bacterium]|nr:type II toxin-antitoxin system HicB family antitoxin [Betaproteobacteria bacterium]
MRYAIVIEAVEEPGFPPGYFYAHVPALDLTTHGVGIEGAKDAARDLIALWVEEKRAHGEHVPREADSYFAHVEIDDALLGA